MSSYSGSIALGTEKIPGSPLFTAIMCTYNRPALMKEAVAALCRQTYQNMEIILINNGGTPETGEHLNQVAAADGRVKLVNFEENVYSPNDPAKYVDVCFNAALEVATGDYIWCQSDDDFLAEDYAERMVALFQDNPECTSAAGLPVSVDVNSELNDTGPGRPISGPVTCRAICWRSTTSGGRAPCSVPQATFLP